MCARARTTGRWIAALAGASAALGPASKALAQGAPPPSPVLVDAARMESVLPRRQVTGELRAVQRAEVASQESGLLVELLVSEGARVKRGDVLARLDDERLGIMLAGVEAELAAQESTIAERQADVELAAREKESIEDATKNGAANVKELRDATSEHSAAVARRDSAERMARLIATRADLLRVRLEDMTIRAPFDGVVVSKMTQVGQWVDEGDAVAELLSTDPLEVWLDVPQRNMPLMLGWTEPVTITLEATGETLRAEAPRVVPAVDPRARTFSLVARVANADGRLTSGMSVIGWAPTGEPAEHLTVSKDAVMRNEVGSFVYVVRAMGPDAPPAAMPANIETLFELPERVAIRPGAVAPGDLVVVEGNERLYPTAPVTPTARAGAVARAGGAEKAAPKPGAAEARRDGGE